MTDLQTMAADENSFASMFNESAAAKHMRVGEAITAEIIEIDNDWVVVNAGLKSESYIPIEEFLSDQGELEAEVGQFVKVSIVEFEDGHGETRLSRERARRAAAWIDMETALNEGTIIVGTIVGRVKGGLTVMTAGLRAFLPGSLVDTRPVRDITPYEGQTLEFKVIKLDRRRNNVVLSRRAVLEEALGEEREKLLETLEEGKRVRGIVKNLTDYGAFVDLGGIDGLLHITDLAWKRTRHPSEVVNVGDEVEALVLKFDQDKQRVSLGLKQLQEDPWMGIARRYPQGTRLFGKVTNLTDYGAFVEVEPGIEGLVHVSEMDWANRNINPQRVVRVGQETEVMIIDIDEERRRISLGMKQCQPNPWIEFRDNVSKGTTIKGPIRSITDFGIFIGLPGGIDGLVHSSDLSWSGSGEDVIRNFEKGQEVDAVVLGVDIDKERISLGIKQLDSDPFQRYTSSNERNAQVTGKVISVDEKGAELELDQDVTGYLHVSEFSSERIADLRTVVNVDDQLGCMIIQIDRKNRQIKLSIKARDDWEKNQAIKEYAAQATTNAESAGTTNLGALLKAKLDSSKEESEVSDD